MSEPRFANYLQLHIYNTAILWSICELLRDAGIEYKFSQGNHANTYCMINLKRKNAVWKSIKTETKVKEIDPNFMSQLKLLESVSREAQLALLLDPM